jgi:hypothetical protein
LRSHRLHKTGNSQTCGKGFCDDSVKQFNSCLLWTKRCNLLSSRGGTKRIRCHYSSTNSWKNGTAAHNGEVLKMLFLCDSAGICSQENLQYAINGPYWCFCYYFLNTWINVILILHIICDMYMIATCIMKFMAGHVCMAGLS